MAWHGCRCAWYPIGHREMKRALIGFLLGAVLCGAGMGWWILDLRGTINSLRRDLESADQALIRSQVRIVRVTETIERVRERIVYIERRIDTSIGRVEEIQGGLESGLGILKTIRGQPLD